MQILAPQELAELAELQQGQTGTVYDQERDVRVVPTRPRTGPPPGPPPAPPRRSRRGPVWLALVVLLAVVAGLAGWYFGIARYTVTPGVIDMSRTAAQTKLDQSGLDLKVTGTAYSETVRKGFVVSTDPAPGRPGGQGGHGRCRAVAGPGAAQGPRRPRPHPRRRAADARRRQAGLRRRDPALRREGAQGPRRHQRPGPGHSRCAATPRSTSWSARARRPIAIPDFTGKNAEVAAKRLGTLGFKVDDTQVNSDTVAKGRVISQSPRSGNGNKGDVVSLVVSKGPVLVAVPNVKGMGLQAATDTLQAAGFAVQVRHASLYVGVKYVVGTDPSSGTMARKGSTVIVSIV